MAHVTLILGGCRSGKSGFALKTANETKADQRIFIATAVALDEEMRARVKQHRADRGAGWMTVEAPLALAEAVTTHAGQGCVILVDCLTLWVSNLLLEVQDPAQAAERIPDLVNAVRAAPCPVILVSNEVGSGIVPENQLARRFRDLAGMANQAVAACAHTVVWTVAGIPVVIKQP